MIWFIFILILLFFLIKTLNKYYVLLALCKRIRSADNIKLEHKVHSIRGLTIFGNTFDFVNISTEKIFEMLRSNAKEANGKSYIQHFLNYPVYSITRAEDATDILQSQTLIKKNLKYDIMKSFMGEGLLTSTNKKWHFRRKILTPAFHFHILKSFTDIFKEESIKLVNVLKQNVDEIVALQDIIPQFTLNNVCETALGIKLDKIEGSLNYRHSIHEIEKVIVNRIANPIMYFRVIFWLFGPYKKHMADIKIAHGFSSDIIANKRRQFQEQRKNIQIQNKVNEFGSKQRYAMLDTLLEAEADGLIDHEGICDEVNTFMFEGYDTTSMCLVFLLLNLACHQEIQSKCFKEIENLASINELTVYDLNQLEYLECVIKETLRLYPSVPILGRECNEETILNGLLLPPQTQIDIHAYDIMRDSRHFPDPETFDPERFRPENTTNRHPFAFIPFSAGPRNCIGQKFAMLEVKMIIVAILKNFRIMPVTNIKDLGFIAGLVLRTKTPVKVQFIKREEKFS